MRRVCVNKPRKNFYLWLTPVLLYFRHMQSWTCSPAKNPLGTTATQRGTVRWRRIMGMITMRRTGILSSGFLIILSTKPHKFPLCLVLGAHLLQNTSVTSVLWKFLAMTHWRNTSVARTTSSGRKIWRSVWNHYTIWNLKFLGEEEEKWLWWSNLGRLQEARGISWRIWGKF